jgi:farnesol dehydrogenase
MKVFITGGTGFLGSRLAEILYRDGHSIAMLVRYPEVSDRTVNESIKIIKGDLSDMEAILGGMNGCDLVFHMAASAKPWYKDMDEPPRTIVTGSENVFKAALISGVKRVVFTSTAGTMGYSKNNELVCETTNSNPEFFTQYERLKARAEIIAMDYCEKGLDIVTVNPTRVFGPGRLTESNSVTKVIDMYIRGLWRILPGKGYSIGNYVFIDDVIHGHRVAALKGKKGERYILGGENLSLREMFLIIDEITGRKRFMFSVPETLLKTGIKLAMSYSGITGTVPPITMEWYRKYMNNWIMTSDKAISELGYVVTPFREGVSRTINWLYPK